MKLQQALSLLARKTTPFAFGVCLTFLLLALGFGNFENINDSLEALDLHVDPKHRRKGLATAMYKFARELGNDIAPSSKQTAMGKLFWTKDHSQ